MTAVQRDLQPAQVPRNRVDTVVYVAVDRVEDVVDRADTGAHGTLPVPLGLGEGLDLVFQVVGQLEAVPAEELDAVVLRRVVRRRDHDPAIGTQLAHEEGDRGRRDDAGQQRVGAPRADARYQRGLKQVAASARVAPDDDPSAALVAEEVSGGLAQLERKLR